MVLEMEINHVSNDLINYKAQVKTLDIKLSDAFWFVNTLTPLAASV